MKKLKLDVEQVKVASFSTRGTPTVRPGTVRGHGDTDPSVFTWPTCNDYQTCVGYICPDFLSPPETMTCDCP